MVDLLVAKLRRQEDRRARRQRCRELHETMLLHLAYSGYTEEQKLRDQQLKTQSDWLWEQQT